MPAHYAIAVHRIRDAVRSQCTEDQILWAANEMATCILRIRIAQYHQISHISFIFVHKFITQDAQLTLQPCVLLDYTELQKISSSPNSKQPSPSSNLVES
jgi:hypothetical protein